MPSIRDVAKVAGVSPASVSRILNKDPDFHINVNTRKRVLETAKRLNYSKTKNKRGPKGKKGMSIGLILRHTAENEPGDPYFKNIHDGITDEAAKWRLDTNVVFRMHDKNKDWEELSKYGAVILVGQMTNDAIKRIKSLNENVILVDANPDLDYCDYIQNDFTDKTTQILNHLYELGHRNIAFIGGNSSIVDMDGNTIPLKGDSRAVTYSNWMKIKELNKYEHSYISDWSIEDGFEMCNKMIDELDELPSAIIVASDPMALGVYKSLNNHHISIPDQVSIISFDDVEMNRYLTPSLSSVYMDSREMGKTAVRLAKDMMIEKSANTMPLVITCRSQLRLRDSVTKKV
ncbi:LacI family DNA-binding transcriptional regulator [Lactobacillus hamsteri]|uniref:LacI family transcriptional regulator n=1 Tax=Lactobacillus hamsteri DSM 5661 = JCM 6256 TaxID=1423754 RepID=A0A0R1YMU7_9LACO|nr:LacI family DNA-binding transcriptional regulator [Lactobacillus hamsteri]KRM40524.1 LacI family transcriptional regulator [Lactobacillus hamsteri DSM 5661 = JCM 6256]